MIGQTVSHYKILEKLGEGGMGVVYKAEDTKLTRTVALKFLPEHASGSETDKARFLVEAQSAATLNHPNICAIHAIEEHESRQFIDMEFVEGETLRRKLPIRNFGDAISYAIQIGEALQEAHSKGIVHRDIKADNIMVNSKGQIKVMDFGLAKLKGSMKLTKTSSTVGTLAYMAPEQIQGGEVDARSDIFSWGVVMYEMLTGRTPFRGEHEASMMYSILNEPPEPLSSFVPDASPEILHLMNRVLEKDPDDRYQTVAEVLSELRRLKKGSTRVSRISSPEIASPAGGNSSARPVTKISATGDLPLKRPRWKQPVTLAVGLVSIAALVVAAYMLFWKKGESLDSIAVLPFVNVNANPDAEFMSDGITESIINGLSRVQSLHVIPRSSAFYYKGKMYNLQDVGATLNVRTVLTGRVTQRGDMLNIQAELTDVKEQAQIWGEQYNRKVSDLMATQQDISTEIAGRLRQQLTGEEKQKLGERATNNPEAYELYLKGRYYWNKRSVDGLNKGIEYFQQAVEKDPLYSLAYSGLADSYGVLGWFEYGIVPPNDCMPKARIAALKAVELNPDLAEAHASLAYGKEVYEYDWKGAESEYLRSFALNPRYPTAHQWYSELLATQGRLDESIVEMRKGLELDPLSLIITRDVGWMYYFARHYAEAGEYFKKALEMDPNFMRGHLILGELFVQQGKFKEAHEEFAAVTRLSAGSLGRVMTAYSYAKEGRKSDALKILSDLQREGKEKFVPSAGIAIIYAALGQRDQAFEWLGKAYDERSGELIYLRVDPFFDELRSDPRFADLLRKTGLQK